MDAAIQEAVKDIPYPVDEEETINISHNFPGSGTEDETYTYTIESSRIDIRAMKEFNFETNITGKEAERFFPPGTYTVKINLPSGGKYIAYNNGKCKFYSGGETLITHSGQKPNADSVLPDDFDLSFSDSLCFARLS